MKWSDEEVYRLCQAAYHRGIEHEKAYAVEAHRLRCCHLIGNRCMNHSAHGSSWKRVCDGQCVYVRRYEVELYRLET